MRIIKFQNLFWIFVVVLISACNPSKSSQPAEMPQPKLTIYPQPIISTTLTAIPSSTPTPINTPLLETATPVPAPSRPNIQELNSVGCMGLEDRWDCIDTYLEIEFQTPFDWRMYRSTLSQATCGGYLYRYEPPRFGMFEFWARAGISALRQMNIHLLALILLKSFVNPLEVPQVVKALAKKLFYRFIFQNQEVFAILAQA